MGKVLLLLPFCGRGNRETQRTMPFAQGHRAGTPSPHVKSDTAIPGQAPVTLSARCLQELGSLHVGKKISQAEDVT